MPLCAARMRLRWWTAAALCAWLTACGARSPSPASASAPPPPESLPQLVESYWDATSERHADPLEPIELQALADARALEARYLDAVRALPRPAAPEAALTYDVFVRERQLALEGFTFPAELMPINPFRSGPFALATSASVAALAGAPAPLWEARARAFARWVDAAMINLREGLRRGYVLQRSLVEQTLPALALLAADTPDNPFVAGLGTRPALSAAVRERILPAYGRLYAFLRDEYLPQARLGVALRDLPLGEAWYAYRVRLDAGAGASPTELAAFGRAEVERLQGRIQAVLAETAYGGNLTGFLESRRRETPVPEASPDPLEWLKMRATETAVAAATLFPSPPHAPVLFLAVPGFEVPLAALLAYQPSVAAGPAILWVNAAAGAVFEPPAGGVARVLRESVPGHHLERGLAAERSALPRFRRFGGDRAYIAGWGLYVAGLAAELGFERDVSERLSPLLEELECAADLVLDTGLQVQGWTRAQAIAYLRGVLPVDEAVARSAVDRLIALPGEGLSCTVGLRTLRALRLEAQQRQGARFDARAFHQALLEEGALPLDLLQSRMHRWIESR